MIAVSLPVVASTRKTAMLSWPRFEGVQELARRVKLDLGAGVRSLEVLRQRAHRLQRHQTTGLRTETINRHRTALLVDDIGEGFPRLKDQVPRTRAGQRHQCRVTAAVSLPLSALNLNV